MTAPSLRLSLAIAIGFALLAPPAQSFAQDEEEEGEEEPAPEQAAEPEEKEPPGQSQDSGR